MCFIRVISLSTETMMPAPCNGNDKQFDYTFLIICRYLKLVKNQKKSEDNFIANRKFTSCYNIKMYRI